MLLLPEIHLALLIRAVQLVLLLLLCHLKAPSQCPQFLFVLLNTQCNLFSPLQLKMNDFV